MNAQAKNDYNWILGYPDNIPKEYFGGIRIDFNNNATSPDYFFTQCPTNEPAILNSDSGRLLAYSDGCHIYNSEHDIMENGDSLAYGEIWDTYCTLDGYPGTQHHILLPWPGDTSKAILFYKYQEPNFVVSYLLYAVIKFDSEHPLGQVIERDVFLITPGDMALITAVKHGNGRDWWVMLPEDNTNRFFSFLLDPGGVSLVDSQRIGHPWEEREWASQAIFTTDGSRYIRFNPWKGLDIFDFDRCSGQLSKPIESGPFSSPIKVGGGVATSIDSKYLYVSNLTELYQFDLNATDILSTKALVGVYDGYSNPFPTTFYQMSLAPDGKIYMFSTNGVRFLHVINKPEEEGAFCDFKQHSFPLPAFANIGSLNIPYFRLGPNDLGGCDTLGIDNLPIAYFKYEIDTLDLFKVHFNNLSYFNPTEFHWEFQSVGFSENKDPGVIPFPGVGIYDVCLTVSNEYSDNTYCQSVTIYDTITHNFHTIHSEKIDVFPNPFSKKINIHCTGEIDEMTIEFFSLVGQSIHRELLTSSQTMVDLQAFQNGLYFYAITSKGNLLESGKLIKVN